MTFSSILFVSKRISCYFSKLLKTHKFCIDAAMYSNSLTNHLLFTKRNEGNKQFSSTHRDLVPRPKATIYLHLIEHFCGVYFLYHQASIKNMALALLLLRQYYTQYGRFTKHRTNNRYWLLSLQKMEAKCQYGDVHATAITTEL